MKHIFSILLIISSIIHGQVESQNSQIGSFEEYQLSSQKYISNDQGQIFMKVNIWGEVRSPGSHRVYDGIDFASLLSIVGGPSKAANLKNVRLYREEPDKEGNLVYTINLDKFIKSGDRSSFIKIYPNDTIIIQSKIYTQVLDRISSINLFLSLFTITLQVLTLFS